MSDAENTKLQPHRVASIARGDVGPAPHECISMARELLIMRTRVAMLEMDLERGDRVGRESATAVALEQQLARDPGVFANGVARGRADERRDVLAWLRRNGATYTDEEIERGEHVRDLGRK